MDKIEKNNSNDEARTRVRILDFNFLLQANHLILQMLKEQCVKILEDLQNERQVKENIENNTEKSITDTQKYFDSKVIEEKGLRESTGHRLSQKMIDSSQELSMEIKTDSRNHNTKLGEQIRQVQDSLAEVKAMVDSEHKNR